MDHFVAEHRRKRSLADSASSMHQVFLERRDGSYEELGSSAPKLSFNGADILTNEARNPKRFRFSSAGIHSSICQVDDCQKDLKHEKDYHRRHKVCEIHSKAPQCMVLKMLQRFCQQCSRFHPLLEFDEGKRSCRRRLAGHNKRRRKTDGAASGVGVAEVGKGVESFNIASSLSQTQVAKCDGNPDFSSMDRESIIQCLRKMAPLVSLPTIVSSGAPRNHQIYQVLNLLNQEKHMGITSPLAGIPKDTLASLIRNILQAQASTVQGRVQSEKVSSQSVINDQSIHAFQSQAANNHENNSRNTSMNDLPFALAHPYQKSTGDPDPADLSPKQDITEQCHGRTGSSSLEEEETASPPSSTATPPSNNGAAPSSEVNLHEEQKLSPCLLSGGDKTRQLSSDHSDCASNQSLASSSSTGMMSNGRIVFKLLDPKRIAAMTRSHESEIEQWLSSRPISVEGYLRPGCVLLTVFVSMPRYAWEKLVANLRCYLRRLVHLSQSELWTKGRIVVQVEHQRALIFNGKVKKVRFSRAVKAPSLQSVRPLAVVAGEESSISVCGYNLVPKTRIVCVYHGRYVLHEVPWSSSEAIALDSSCNSFRSVYKIQFPGGPPNVLGRCFIEAEHDSMGNALPVIVASKEICSELQSLEVELDAYLHLELEKNGASYDELSSSKEMEAMNFLHELGWIFQDTSKHLSKNEHNMNTDINEGDRSPHVDLSRFKVVLKYAVSRDWCALVKQLLDLLFCNGIDDNAGVQDVLSEVNLVHQAVKRKCRPMLELLLHYQPHRSKLEAASIFTPVDGGPGGFTPLHIAASLADSEEVLDALTEDPNEVGLHGWKSLCDHSGCTPEWYAQISGKLSYIELVERKLLRKISQSVRIRVFDVLQSHLIANTQCNNLIASKVNSLDGTDIMALEPTSSRSQEISGSIQICRNCRAIERRHTNMFARSHIRIQRPLLMMMVAVATLCATVALLYKTGPTLDVMYSLKWEGIMYGIV
ncbi:hypothetical protein KP509_10G052200 [Ceratopteris richardii]|uniref:SBP-type domain-containing protein n=1 Tax=Ceratopteris richardii TaxID=49495 RepID=A0A8T2U128_CERRI|nr:hypothetical protein KP509_10G052200 [Ceratopteris richardii]